MTDSLAIALAQINPTVGDLARNAERLLAARARVPQADLVVFPELAVSGYPPEDLVLKPFFQRKVEDTVDSLRSATADGGPAMLVSAPWRQDGALYNAALLLDRGELAAVRLKHMLPNYGVFDEKRVFAAGPVPGPVNFRDVRLGIATCEDIWNPDVTECLAESGAELLLVLNGSPYETDKLGERMQHAVARVVESGLPLAYVNQVGGQDELVFDGASFVLNADRSLALQLPSFEEAIVTTRWRRSGDGWVCNPGERVAEPDTLSGTYLAMTLGLRDYVGKNGFPGVIIGLSGGIDSALTAAVAVDALGADRVRCVMMPSPYTSKESLEDAAEAAALLGVHLDEIGIAPAMSAFAAMLGPVFGDRGRDTTEENIQARTRGMLLMAMSNKLGHMVLTTGNKSEMSVGYATLYGDMCGGFSVLKDVYKTIVFALSHWRNRTHLPGLRGPAGRVIPERTIVKPPTAELKPDQKDQDTLPPYDALDDVLQCLVEGELGLDEIVARGHTPELVQRVWRMLDTAEYKRRQAPPGVKITRRAFGRDRRYPITNGFRLIL